MNSRSFSAMAAIVATMIPVLASSAPEVDLEPVYTNLKLDRPVTLQIPGDDSNRRFLAQQTGKILILPGDENGSDAKVFLDLADGLMAVEKAFEEGLLGFTFHPKYRDNGKFYIYYSKQGPKRTVLSEFTVSKQDPDKADPASERILLQIQQPDWNHNSGNLLFNPEDGYLYITVGDGGRRNGVFMMAPNKTLWNGKVLRIDVDSKSPGREYGIPKDNPFLNEPATCPEIWAYGLRNPWGAAFDPKTGLFYLADVGQDLWEEINIIKKGGNYGWEFREGAQDFEKREKLMEAIGEANKKPKDVVLIDPIQQYDHSPAGGMSVTGGYVYHGKAIPELVGRFIYGDWRFGNMWALHYAPETGQTNNAVIHAPKNVAEPVAQPSGFYPDEKGEPLVLCWKGKIFRMVAKKQ